MLRDALLAYAHYLSIIAVFVFLVLEVAFVHAPLSDPRGAARLSRIDIGFFVSAIAALLTGAGRATLGAKGWQFYAHNPFFIAKVSLFFAIAIFSVLPTMLFLRWARGAESGAAPAAGDVQRARRYVRIELALLLLLPLFAVLMARGIGS